MCSKKLSYSSDLTDEQFKLIEKYLPKVKRTKPCKYSKLSLLNGCLYVLRTGCQWRMLPDKYPPFRTVHKYFRILCIGFKLEKIVCNLNKVLEKKLSKENNQSVKYPDVMLIVDSKTIRSSEYFERKYFGIDGNKKIKGIKLCAVTDRLRRCWRVEGIAGNVSEYKGVTRSIEATVYSKVKPNAKVVIGDRYFDSKKLRKEFKNRFNLELISLQRNPKRKFELPEDKELQQRREQKKKEIINPWRWIVEQFFSHLEKARRLVMIYERKLKSYLGFVKLRVIQLLIKRLGV